MTTTTVAPAFRYLGITDECVECQRCGRVDLRSTVVLAVLDEDGNTEDVTYYGSHCAARALGIQGGGRAVLSAARVAHDSTNELAKMARGVLAFYGLPETGTPSLRELREPLWKFVEAHSNARWMEGSTADENRARLLECLAAWQRYIRDAAALAGRR
jgi:hypothetical protein